MHAWGSRSDEDDPQDKTLRRLQDLIRFEMVSRADEGRARLPNEPLLMRTYDASRDTVREALRRLVEAGLVLRRPGLGTLAIGDQRKLPTDLPPPRTPLAEHVGAVPGRPRVLFWGLVPARPVVARELDGVETGDPCLCVDYVLVRGDQPVGVVTNYLRAGEASLLDETAFDSDLYALLEHAGIGFDAFDVAVQASRADRSVAPLLDVEAGEPVLWLEQTLRNGEGEVFGLALCHFQRELRLDFVGISRTRRRTAPPEV
ncbi:GntR family transcriptional regulator [Nocardiopsis valliformis]|uniref:GntR family transcriptional regulator n=1 Tax=Nocardiopsis valliformis TaxID=239974 RepID=UPI00034B2F5E|nr:GntR family transcriptional regulator [Nocardiopsis valliformis]